MIRRRNLGPLLRIDTCRRNVPWATVAMALLGLTAMLTPACGRQARDMASGSRAAHPAPSPPLENTTPKEPAAFLGPVRTIEANGIEIGYRQFGSGRPLVVVMGQAGTMSLWEYGFMKRLADAGFHVTMFDNRGMGYSSDPRTEPLSIELMARDTVSLIDSLGLERPTLVGWSMGGQIGLAIGVQHGDKVGTIITCGSTAGSPNQIADDPQADAALEDPNVPAEKLLDYLFPPAAIEAREAFVRSVPLYPPQQVDSETIRRQAEAEDAYAEDTTVWDGLPNIRNKVVLTNGSDDLLAPAANASRIGPRIDGAVVEIFDGAGHAALMQDQVRFVDLVAEYA